MAEGINGPARLYLSTATHWEDSLEHGHQGSAGVPTGGCGKTQIAGSHPWGLLAQ